MSLYKQCGASLWIAVQILAVALLLRAPAGACTSNADPLGLRELDQALPSFTFDLDVAMRMRSFPWLAFHMLGVGKYQPGKYYTVHFTKVPWFAPRQQHDADLSILDPGMWPARFIYQKLGEQNGDTLFDLLSINDPTLTSATVSLGPKWCAREVKETYDDGSQIKLNVTFSNIDGFMLPASMTADIRVPHASLSGNAAFTNYSFPLGLTRD